MDTKTQVGIWILVILFLVLISDPGEYHEKLPYTCMGGCSADYDYCTYACDVKEADCFNNGEPLNEYQVSLYSDGLSRVSVDCNLTTNSSCRLLQTCKFLNSSCRLGCLANSRKCSAGCVVNW